MMIDRAARDDLAELINSYLDERITAFDFDEQIWDIFRESKDETVRHVARELWYHYDDCQNHTVVLSKQQWDYFQRLLLVLRSDTQVCVTRRRIWSWRQPIAALGLTGFIVVAILLGFGMHLCIVAFPFGLLSLLISWSQPRPSEVMSEERVRLTPFASISEMLAIRRQITGFRKRKYPTALKDKHIRSPFMEDVFWFQYIVLRLLLSPLVLLFQTLPDYDDRAFLSNS